MSKDPGSVRVPTVSTIVTTRNSGSTLERLLKSIRTQTYAAVESIVVDNSSVDETPEIAEQWADLVLQAGPERSAQRNRGATAAAGDFLLVLDADMILEPNVVEECVAVAIRTCAAAIVVPESTIGQGFWSRVRALERSCYEGDETIEAARFFEAEVFRRYAGYDEQLTGPEDWDLPARMRAAGERVERADGAQILHDESDLKLLPHLRKKYYYGRSFAGYLRRHPTLAARQLSVVRPAFVRHSRRLARRPLLSAAMVGLKLAEMTAGAAGLVAARVDARSKVSRPPPEGRTPSD